MLARVTGPHRERGVALILVALGMTAILGVGALAVEMGLLYQARTKLQATADAVALAAVTGVPDGATVRARAHEYVGYNEPDHGSILTDPDIVLGNWSDETATFTPAGTPTNAVNVTLRRVADRDNPVGLLLGRLLGFESADIVVIATAVYFGGGTFTRFLIDEELIDSDIPSIEELAEEMGVTPDDLINDNDGDWFIDLPEGEILDLPTGQEGDEGLFDIKHETFEFTSESDPSLLDFLNYNEDSSSWRYDLVPKEMLDPLMGVIPVDDPDRYPEFVTMECQVSPVYKSDLSELDPVTNEEYEEEPAVNGLGWRRGLLAFKIIEILADPDGPDGSVLPDVRIEVCPPGLPGDPSEVGSATEKRVRLVE